MELFMEVKLCYENRAKDMVERDYPVIGTKENFAQSLKVYEWKYPQFFKVTESKKCCGNYI